MWMGEKGGEKGGLSDMHNRACVASSVIHQGDMHRLATCSLSPELLTVLQPRVRLSLPLSLPHPLPAPNPSRRTCIPKHMVHIHQLRPLLLATLCCRLCFCHERLDLLNAAGGPPINVHQAASSLHHRGSEHRVRGSSWSLYHERE